MKVAPQHIALQRHLQVKVSAKTSQGIVLQFTFRLDSQGIFSSNTKVDASNYSTVRIYQSV